MRRSFGIIFMVLGAALLLGAIGLTVYNIQEEKSAQQAADDYLSKLITLIPENSSDSPQTSETAPDGEESSVEELPNGESIQEESLPGDAHETGIYVSNMLVTEVDGYEFVGFISIPKLNLQLPVMSETEMKLLRVSPCRFSGSPKTDDLVVGAHNYSSHFGNISKLSEGDAVIFTDMEGNIWNYKVVFSETLGPNDVDYLTSGEYPLTIYTCVYGGGSRVTVRCERA